jgi:hypothetical protein
MYLFGHRLGTAPATVDANARCIMYSSVNACIYNKAGRGTIHFIFIHPWTMIHRILIAANQSVTLEAKG